MKKTLAIGILTVIASLSTNPATAQETDQTFDRGDRIEHRLDKKPEEIPIVSGSDKGKII
jgi:hypothetical protein